MVPANKKYIILLYLCIYSSYEFTIEGRRRTVVGQRSIYYIVDGGGPCLLLLLNVRQPTVLSGKLNTKLDGFNIVKYLGKIS